LLAAFVLDALDVSSAGYWWWCSLRSRAALWLWPSDRPSPPVLGLDSGPPLDAHQRLKRLRAVVNGDLVRIGLGHPAGP
jgi:hypothetical protein